MSSDSVFVVDFAGEPGGAVLQGILSIGRIWSLFIIFVLKVAANACSSLLNKFVLMLVVDMSFRCSSLSSFGDVRSWSSLREWISCARHRKCIMDLFILFTAILPPFGPRDNWFSHSSAKKELRYSLGVIALSSMIFLTSFGGMTVKVRTVVFPFSNGRSVQRVHLWRQWIRRR